MREVHGHARENGADLSTVLLVESIELIIELLREAQHHHRVLEVDLTDLRTNQIPAVNFVKSKDLVMVIKVTST